MCLDEIPVIFTSLLFLMVLPIGHIFAMIFNKSFYSGFTYDVTLYIHTTDVRQVITKGNRMDAKRQK
jgi:hypothetical protein